MTPLFELIVAGDLICEDLLIDNCREYLAEATMAAMDGGIVAWQRMRDRFLSSSPRPTRDVSSLLYRKTKSWPRRRIYVGSQEVGGCLAEYVARQLKTWEE